VICDRCKRRPARPGKRLCVTCYHVLRADRLALEVALLRADVQDRNKKLAVLLDRHPMTENEIADARIVRCPRCDARRLPDSPHECKRKAVAA